MLSKILIKYCLSDSQHVYCNFSWRRIRRRIYEQVWQGKQHIPERLRVLRVLRGKDFAQAEHMNRIVDKLTHLTGFSPS